MSNCSAKIGVNSKQAVDKAGEIVRSVKGVKSLKNNLIVK